MPIALYGVWVNDDPALAGRALEIGRHSVRFLDGNAELSHVVVETVEQDGDAGASTRFVVRGRAEDGAEVDLAFVHVARPEQLRMETYREPWRRAEGE